MREKERDERRKRGFEEKERNGERFLDGREDEEGRKRCVGERFLIRVVEEAMGGGGR